MTDQTPAEQWNAAASGWARWAARSGDYIGPATEKMLDLAGVGPGGRVLDVGCGSGEQTVLAAHRVGTTGHVLAIDIAAPMIAAAEKTIAAAGLTNVSTRVCSAEALADDACFDAAISRLVLMLIPDPLAAARAVWTVLRPGGSFAAIVPGNPERDVFASTALDILARHGGTTVSPHTPGSFRSLTDPDRLSALYQTAGFIDVTVSAEPTLRRLDSAATATAMIRDGFAFFKALVRDLPPQGQEAAWADVETALQRFEGPEGLAAPGELNLVVGRKPAG